MNNINNDRVEYDQMAEEKYLQAQSIFNNAKKVKEYKEALNIFSSIINYKDARKMANLCKKKISKANNIKLYIISGISFLAIVITVIFLLTKNSPSNIYKSAVNDFNNRDYVSALNKFYSLNGKCDTGDYIESCVYNIALGYLNNGDYDSTIELFSSIKNINVDSYIIDCKYNKALSLLNDGFYKEAYDLFNECDNYKDSIKMKDECNRVVSNQNTINNPVCGSSVFFGQYEQDNNISNGKEYIEWEILNLAMIH